MRKKSKAEKKSASKEELPRKRVSKRRKATNWKSIFMVGALVLVMISFILSSIPFNFDSMKSGNNTSNTSTNTPAKKSAPEFRKDGTLQFLKTDGTSIGTNIEIEVADSEYEHAQGLMHRRFMDANRGMLFIMDEFKVQSFYMRNTHIPLDIIYLDDQKTIVSIQKNTVPLSEESLPSEGDALYVLEVNAGYCDQHGIGPGDQISFQISE